MSRFKKKFLPGFLRVSGLVCLAAYPLHVIWPSGWEWGMEGRHYLWMILVVYAVLGIFLILAAKDPEEHRSLLMFTAWSSLAHGLLMLGQAIHMQMWGHLLGDVQAMIVLGAMLLWLMPEKTNTRVKDLEQHSDSSNLSPH